MNKKATGFGGGCQELGIVAAGFVCVLTFTAALVLNLHASMPLPSAAFYALLAAVLAFGLIALLLTLVYAAVHFFGGKIDGGI